MQFQSPLQRQGSVAGLAHSWLQLRFQEHSWTPLVKLFRYDDLEHPEGPSADMTSCIWAFEYSCIYIYTYMEPFTLQVLSIWRTRSFIPREKSVGKDLVSASLSRDTRTSRDANCLVELSRKADAATSACFVPFGLIFLQSCGFIPGPSLRGADDHGSNQHRLAYIRKFCSRQLAKPRRNKISAVSPRETVAVRMTLNISTLRVQTRTFPCTKDRCCCA